MGLLADLLGIAYLALEKKLSEDPSARFLRDKQQKNMGVREVVVGASERSDREERIKRHEEARQLDLKNQGEFVRKYARLGSTVFIDSNIWMNDWYRTPITRFCELCSEEASVFVFRGEQYAEIQKIRKRTERATDSEEVARSGAAATAIRLIRDLARRGLLELEEMKESTSHVDDFIVAQAKIANKSGTKFLLITDDIELQTRVFTVKSRGRKDICHVIPGEEFKALFSVS